MVKLLTVRSSRSQMFFKMGALKNPAIFTEKHLCWSLFLTKLQVFRPATLLKRDCNTSCFPTNIAEFLKPALFIEHFRWLLVGCIYWFPQTIWAEQGLYNSSDSTKNPIHSSQSNNKEKIHWSCSQLVSHQKLKCFL